MMEARFFSDVDASEWDGFCGTAYNATFLHTRRFLSYHANRFLDRSVILLEHEKWIGAMPAAASPNDRATVVSHPGISYGGILHAGKLRGTTMLTAIRTACDLLSAAGYQTLQYKAIPHIYHRAPADDDLYALFRLNARLYRRDLSSCIDLAGRLPVSERRQRGLKKAHSANVRVGGGASHVEHLWQILADNLERKHGTRPTHSKEEITLLAHRFPREIQFCVALVGDDVVAGTVLFNCGITTHAQYIAVSEAGQEIHALDALFEHCIEEATGRGMRYFDFGISTDDQGHLLNEGLYRFKSEFGASGLAHSFYELETKGFAS